MSIRDDILAVMRATKKPLQAKEIARVLEASTMEVASHLGYMRKKGIVMKGTVLIGEPIQYGHYAFPSGGSATVWYAPESLTRGVLQRVRYNARVNKTLPCAVLPQEPVPHTYDMTQMLDDMQAELHRASGIPFNLLGNRK